MQLSMRTQPGLLQDGETPVSAVPPQQLFEARIKAISKKMLKTTCSGTVVPYDGEIAEMLLLAGQRSHRISGEEDEASRTIGYSGNKQ